MDRRVFEYMKSSLIQGWTKDMIRDKDTSLGKGTRGTRLKSGFQMLESALHNPDIPVFRRSAGKPTLKLTLQDLSCLDKPSSHNWSFLDK